MAVVTITKVPDAYCFHHSMDSTQVTAWGEDYPVHYTSIFGGYWNGFLFNLPFQAVIHSVTVELLAKRLNDFQDDNLTTIYCELYEGENARDWQATEISRAEKKLYNGEYGTYSFSLNGHNLDTSQFSIRIGTEGFGREVQWAHFTITLEFIYPSLSIEASPDPVYATREVTLSFENRIDQALNVSLANNGSVLSSYTAESDALTIPCLTEWLDRVSNTTNEITVTVTANDSLERSATTRFKLKRPHPSAVSPVAPRSSKLEGANQINFGWTVDTTNGEQAEAWLEWSDDNVVYTQFGHVVGAGSIFTVPGKTFPPGLIYWRVKIRNIFDLISTSSNVTFTVDYAATSYTVPFNSPTSGVINGQAAQTFSVKLEANGTPYEPFTVDHAMFYWRLRNSGPFTALKMAPDGGLASVVIEAGTFISGSIQWYAEATDNTGHTTQTTTYTLSVLQADVEAIPLAPIDTIESGSSEITFRWDYGSVDSSPQNRVELQISRDGEIWEALATISGSSERSYTAEANTFGAGLIYWRARATSQSGVTGPWSKAVSFNSFAAPRVTEVAADSMPFATVTWKVTSQISFEIDIDGKVYGDYGSSIRQYTWPTPLAPGAHTVKVRSQNQYSLWSEWEEASFVTYSWQETIHLQGEADESVHLMWTGGDAAQGISVQPQDASTSQGRYYIYRDGELLAQSDGNTFEDRTAIGDHSYTVMYRHSNNNVSVSNTVTLTVEIDCHLIIGRLDGGSWQHLRLSEQQHRELRITRRREVAWTHYAGTRYPEADVGESEDLIAAFDCSWKHSQKAEADAFEQLIGECVVLKSRSGAVIVGVLAAFERRDPKAYRSYTAELRQDDWGGNADA